MNISMLTFFQTGMFGNLMLGKTKEWVREHFAFPDGSPSLKAHRQSNIWQYGNIELHFTENELFLIYSDDLGRLDGGNRINLDKWILGDPTKRNLSSMKQALSEQEIAYSIKELPHFQQIEITLTPSQVKLIFDDKEPFSLFAFSLMR